MGEIKHHRFAFYAYLFKEKRTEAKMANYWYISLFIKMGKEGREN